MGSPDYDKLILTTDDLKWMNIPSEFWSAKLSEIDEDAKVKSRTGKKYPARATFVKYIRRIKEMKKANVGLLITGEPGIGKTAIATMILMAARQHKYTGFFAMIWELRECIRSRISFDHATSVLDRCREVDFLILDGLSEEDAWGRQFNLTDIERLITYRGQRGRVTIVTSRITAKEWKNDARMKRFYAGSASYLTPLLFDVGDKKPKRAGDDLLFGEED